MSKLWMILMMASLLLSSRSAAAFTVKHAMNGQPVHWATPTVTFVVDPSMEDAAPGGVDAVRTALMAWSGVSGAPDIVVQTGPPGGKAALDGQNTVLFVPDGYAPAGPALAVTVVSYDEMSGEIVDADIVVNGPHAFAVLAAGAEEPGAVPTLVEGAADWAPVAYPFDLVHVVAHEAGHSLGLGDVAEPGEVMYAYSTPGDAAFRAPASDDLAGVDALYGAAPRQAGCGGASIASQSARGGGWGPGLLLAVAAGAAYRRRRAESSSTPRA